MSGFVIGLALLVVLVAIVGLMIVARAQGAMSNRRKIDEADSAVPLWLAADGMSPVIGNDGGCECESSDGGGSDGGGSDNGGGSCD